MTEYSLSEITEIFIKLSERTFKTHRGGILSTFDPLNVLPAFFMAVKAWESKYRTTPLREGLIGLFGKDMPMFPTATFTASQRKVRVAVTSTTSGEPCIFTNYNRITSTGTPPTENAGFVRANLSFIQTTKISNARTNRPERQKSGKRKCSMSPIIAEERRIIVIVGSER